MNVGLFRTAGRTRDLLLPVAMEAQFFPRQGVILSSCWAGAGKGTCVFPEKQLVQLEGD